MRLERLFRLTTGRTPDEAELGVLMRALAALRADFEAAPARAAALLAVGDLEVPLWQPLWQPLEQPLGPLADGLGADGLGASELAAWTMLASTVMNLDEVLVRN